MSKTLKGREFSEESKRKMSEAKRGEKCYLWKGGISFEPYPMNWTNYLRESIRKRDSYICQLCGVHQDELNYKLHCHHIDYDKDNLDPNNLISLCRNCHLDTNSDRDYWKSYLSAFMRDNINNKLN